MIKLQYKTTSLLLMAATFFLGACSDDIDNGSVNNSGREIAFNTNVNGFYSKASTYNSDDDLETEGSFSCFAYPAEATNAYFDDTDVTWVKAEGKWKFANSFVHYWPGISHLDFFAHMPANKPAYITSLTYTTARQPQFVCTGLPTTIVGQAAAKEFVCAMAINKNQENSVPSGVSMQFKHPFAILKFKLDPTSGVGITINWVRIEAAVGDEGHGIYNGGTCTIDGTVSDWSSQAAKDVFAWSSLTGDTYIEAKADESPYLVIPNDYSATKMRISVNATWGGSLSTTTMTKTATVQNRVKDEKKLMNWEPGYSYLFTLKLTDILEVSTARYTVEQW